MQRCLVDEQNPLYRCLSCSPDICPCFVTKLRNNLFLISQIPIILNFFPNDLYSNITRQSRWSYILPNVRFQRKEFCPFSKEYSRNVLILVQIKDRTEISKDLDKMLNLVWLWNTQKEFWQLNHVAKELSSVFFFIFTCCKYFSLMNRILIDHYEKVSLRKNKRIWTFNLLKSTIHQKKKN